MRRSYTVSWFVLLLMGVGVLPALADHGVPEVVTPWPGDTFYVGASGGRVNIEVDFSEAPYDDYWLEVYDSKWDEIVADKWISYDGEDAVRTWQPFLEPSEAYTLWVTDSELNHTESVPFSVVAELRIVNTSISPSVFFPRVKDGYRDKAEFNYRTNIRADNMINVRRLDGTLIRRATLGTQSAYSHTWRWDGRSRNNQLVKTGRYRIELVSRRGDQVKTSSEVVELESKILTRRRTVSRGGRATSDRGKKGNCSIYPIFSSLYLDCWGGKFAKVRYRFGLPRNAFKIGWGVRGERHCCSGFVGRDGERVSRKAFLVEVMVTKWASYEVHRVWVAYSSKERI